MAGQWWRRVTRLVVAGGLLSAVAAASSWAAPAGAGAPVSTYTRPLDQAPVCAASTPGTATCHAVQLLAADQNWRAGPVAPLPRHPVGGLVVPAPPNSGYYPVDLLGAYGWSAAAAHMTPGAGAPTVAVVDAYDDPNAAGDLGAYRASLSGAQDPNTGLTDTSIPGLCPAGTTTGCVSFTKVSETGTTSYPAANTGWAEEISLDLDMVSAICPACNIVLVEAASNSLSDLAQAVREAQSLHPVAITNSYGGGEFSTETSLNSVYAAGTTTAITAAAGDSGFGVEYPAAAPNTTAVGGTTLTHSGTGSSLVWNAQTAWSGSGSGCSAFQSIPTWQADQGVYDLSATCGGRQVADVAAVADPATGVAVYDTFGVGGWTVFGGTSVSAQIIGAAYALAAGNGSVAPSPSSLYPDQGTGSGPTPGLVPVSSGANGSCATYLCNAGASLPSGYNGPTGLGTPNGITAFAGAGTSPPPPVTGTLGFNPAAESLTAGTPSGAVTVGSSVAAPSGGLSVSLHTSSAGGGFATSAAGPFTSTLTVPVPAGATQSGAFYYRDTAAGSWSVTAAASGWISATMAATVAPGPLASLGVTPPSATVNAGSSVTFSAGGHDQFGNPVAVSPAWTTTAPGTLSAPSGTTTSFRAGSTAGSGVVKATQGTLSASASVTVVATPGTTVTVGAGSLSRTRSGYSIPLTVSAKDATSATALSGAGVVLLIYPGSACSGTAAAQGRGTTGSSGKVTFTFTTATARQWCAQATVTPSGHTAGQGQTTFVT